MSEPVPIVTGLSIFRAFADPSFCSALLEEVDRGVWRTALRRRVQHYGAAYSYATKRVDRGEDVPIFPAWAVNLVAIMLESDVIARSFDQLIVNEYVPGQGIAPHLDAPSSFADEIAALSLGSTCLMTFSRPGSVDVPLFLYPGDLIVLRGDARYIWRHEIKPRKVDVLDGKKVPRGRRVSLTFRHMIVSKNS